MVTQIWPLLSFLANGGGSSEKDLTTLAISEVQTVSCDQFPQGQQGPKLVDCSGVTVAGGSFIWSPDQTHRIVTLPQDILPVSSG